MRARALLLACASAGCTFVDPLGDLSRIGPDTADAAGPAFDYVQDNWAAPQGQAASVSVAFAKPQLQGGTNVVAIGWNSIGESITSVTDSNGNPYTAATDLARGKTMSQAVYFAPRVKAGDSTVTVKFSTPALDPDVRVLEYTGGAGDPVVAGAAFDTATSQTATAGPVATTGARELVFLAGMTHDRFVSADNGFAQRIITTPDGDLVADMLSSTAGSIIAAGTLGAADEWLMQVVVFR